MTTMAEGDGTQRDSENAPAATPKPDHESIAEHHAERKQESVFDIVWGGDAAAVMRYLRKTGDPIMVAALLDPDPNAPAPYKLEIKRRRRGRPTRNAQNSTAEKVQAVAAPGVKVESQLAELEAKGISRPTALRYRKLLGLTAKK